MMGLFNPMYWEVFSFLNRIRKNVLSIVKKTSVCGRDVKEKTRKREKLKINFMEKRNFKTVFSIIIGSNVKCYGIISGTCKAFNRNCKRLISKENDSN